VKRRARYLSLSRPGRSNFAAAIPGSLAAARGCDDNLDAKVLLPPLLLLLLLLLLLEGVERSFTKAAR
jgi:hypothetical protein